MGISGGKIENLAKLPQKALVRELKRRANELEVEIQSEKYEETIYPYGTLV